METIITIITKTIPMMALATKVKLKTLLPKNERYKSS